MRIKVTWNDFDKTIFITPKNMRKLMGFNISIGEDVEELETTVANQDQKIEDAKTDSNDAKLVAQAAMQQATKANTAIEYEIKTALASLDRRVTALEGG